MFSRLENWLFLKTFCFLFYYCKDNTKIPIYVLKHSINPLYLTFNVYFGIVFFIVLDLRLTKVGARRCSFFYVYISA